MIKEDEKKQTRKEEQAKRKLEEQFKEFIEK